MSDLKINRIFDILKEVAIATPKVAGARVSAAIVIKNKIISIGVNSLKSSPLQAKYAANKNLSIFLHAEIAAIKNALRKLDVEDFSKSSLYICRMKKDIYDNRMIHGLAKPCPGCRRAIAEFNIKRSFYSLDNYGWEEVA
jgi:deoxycytidylate deaminase